MTLKDKTKSRVISFLPEHQHGDAFQDHKMGRIEDVEEVLQISLSPFSVVGIQQRKGAEGEELYGIETETHQNQAKTQRCGIDGNAVRICSVGQGGKHRKQTAPEAVVDIKYLIQKIYRRNGT